VARAQIARQLTGGYRPDHQYGGKSRTGESNRLDRVDENRVLAVSFDARSRRIMECK
jgi:hypothetical protein